ncbi:MAG: hypothetical protein HKN16_09390 [Saprospiraceae bacterium]|nr:hypothetical protein [Saprospiraceae bacterium]
MILSLSLIQCSIDRSTQSLSDSELKILNQYKLFKPENNLSISPENEPGQKLALCLTFLDKESKRLLKYQEVLFYHTSNTGEYEPSDPNDESTARLSGEAITDDSGRIFIRTILPGNYGSGENNRHIHTTVKGATPEAYDIHFKQHTGFMGGRFINGSDQHFLADLKYDRDSSLVTILTLEIKQPKAQE